MGNIKLGNVLLLIQRMIGISFREKWTRILGVRMVQYGIMNNIKNRI